MARRLGLAVLAALALLALGIPGFVMTQLSDPPIDAGDLRVARLELAPGEDGIELLDAATRAVWWPEARRAELGALLRGGDGWDAALAAEVLERNADALARVRRALEAPYFQLAAFAWEEYAYGAGEDAAWLTPAQLLAIGARAHARAGRPEAAFADALDAVRLGRRLRTARGATLLASLLGLASTEAGLDALADALPRLEPTPEQARRWSERLAAERVEREAWRAMWGVEYTSTALLLDRIASGEDAAAQGLAPEPWSDNRFVFKPNATKALFADFYRTLRERGDAVCRGIPLPELEAPDPRWQRLRAFVGPNGMGQVLFWTAAPDFASFETRRCRTDTRLAVLQATVALRSYQVEHGALPQTLAALVPRHLAALPRDAFDGEPLHYDAASRSLGRARPELPDAKRLPSRWTLAF